MKGGARAVLYWSLSIYALATLGLNAAVNRWCPAPFERVYREKWATLCERTANAPDRPLMVMLGSSRTDAIFQAGRLNGSPGPNGRPWLAYNLGIPAAGPMHEYQYLRDMLDRGIRPRLLLIEYLPPLLNAPHSGQYSEEKWAVAEWMSVNQYLRFRPYLSRPVHKASEWVEVRIGPWFTHRCALHTWLRKSSGLQNDTPLVREKNDEWGCRVHQDFTPAQRGYFSAVASDYIPSLKHFRLGPGLSQAMRDLLACCRREQIPVAFILTPESSVFRSWYRPECLAATQGLLVELRATYGIEVIDATRWLDDDDFVDGHHAGASGARKFTERLRVEVNRRPR